MYLIFFRNTNDYMKSLRAELKTYDVDKPLEWYETEIRANGAVTVHGDWRYDFDYDRFVLQWRKVVGDAISAFSYDKVTINPGLLPFFFERIGASSELIAASANSPKLNVRKAAVVDVGRGA